MFLMILRRLDSIGKLSDYQKFIQVKIFYCFILLLTVLSKSLLNKSLLNVDE